MNTIDKLSKAIIKSLVLTGDLDKPFLNKGDKSYTKNELITAIKNGDPISEELVDDLLGLTIDLVSRGKKSLGSNRQSTL